MKIPENRIHQTFEVSILLKGAHALIEIVGGLFFYLVSTATILSWVNLLTREELTEDPRDFVATHLLGAAQSLTGATENFYAFYLISHGAIKIALVLGLLREKPLAYPLSLAALGVFILYQLYRYSYTHAPALIVLTVFDLVVCWLVWHEWRHRAPAPRA
ncbi:DUF2127 domain-containing protein [Amaricoccus solimangrovi]|uniref:DUF2127 domain-containing protein n=1 Tax=Amaricoccus solimangrovi TaxID=2589815 RepID=A0A501WYP6_9RHOB|nr:DUF2127 domain-containing protein [Amaricoccus solimangrovi]TPE53770.1 DUF2127 domain-containing protein [Amaricoccus solimangrovi]